MQVRISYPVEIGEDFRRAIRRFYGESGLATRAEVKRWFESYGSSMDDELFAFYFYDKDEDD